MPSNTEKNKNSAIEDQKNESSAVEPSERNQCVALFNDLNIFVKTKVQIAVYGGEKVIGNLISFDEVSNCILESEDKRKIIVLGKSITGIYSAESIVL